MKKNYFALLTIFISILLAACSAEEKTVEDVLENVGRGAILRTIAVPSPTFDFNDTSSKWIATIEEQDAQDGDLLDAVDLYVQLLSANGNTEEMLVRTIPGSDFSEGPLGLPRLDIDLSLSEALTALGLSPGEFSSDDQFNIRMALKLSNGQTFTAKDVNPNISGGQFFQSPFNYRAQFFCALTDASLFAGTYTVDTDIWADYQPGDQIPVVVGDDPFTFRILSTENPFITNTDTSYIEVTIDPTDGSATAQSNEPFDYGVLSDVSGSGSVGTCTGDINLTLTYEGLASDQQLILIKN